MRTASVSTALGDVCGIESVLVDPREDKFSGMIHVGGANIESMTGNLVGLMTAREEGLQSGKFVFDDAMVLYSKIRPYLMKVARPGFGGLCSADIYPLRTDDSRLDRGFLYYLLLSEEFTDYAIAGSARAGMPKVNREHLFEFRFVLPELPEQRRIVTLLDEAFSCIATAKDNAERNLRNARVLFESNMRSTLEGYLERWGKRRLGDLCSIARGGSPRPIQDFLTNDSEGINWIKIGDATASGKYIFRTAERIIPEGIKRSRLVHEGDFILSNSMSFGRPYIMKTTGCIHDGWLVLSDYAPLLNQDFLYYVLGSPLVFSQFNTLAAGSTVRNLNIDLAGRVEIPVPPIDVQLQFAELYGAVADETERLATCYRRKIAALDALKRSLLHQAFHGDL